MALELRKPFQRLRTLFNRPAAEQIVYYTRGGDLISPGEYRANFDVQLERALVSHRQVSDESLARALPVSAAAYACTEYRASTTANIPLKVQVNTEDAAWSPLGYFIQEAPQLLDDITRSLLLWGRMYLLKQRNAKGWPTGLQWLNPQNVREVTEGYGRVIAYDIRESATGSHQRYLPDDVVYDQFFDPNPFGMGLSKFEAAWRALNIDLGISTFAASFFLNHAQPDGILILDRTDPLQEADYQAFKRHWRENFKGAQNAHKTAFVDIKASWTPMSNAPKDLAMVELKQTDREDICAIFEVDPMLVGMKDAGDPLSANSTLSTAEVTHIRNVTIPFLRTVVLNALNKQWASKDFDQAYMLMVDTANVPALAEANLAKAETTIHLTTNHVMDYPEARDILGYQTREDYIKRDPEQVSRLWNDGIITRNQYNRLVGVPDTSDSDPNGNVVLIAGQLYPADKLAAIAEANLAMVGQVPAQPSPFGSLAINNQIPALSVTSPEPRALPETTTQTAEVPAAPPAEPITQRTSLSLEVAVSFANNQFVRYAKRALSEALAEQNVQADWIDAARWRIPLARSSDWTPAILSALLRTAAWDDTRKMDLPTGAFIQRGQDVYLTVRSDSLDSLLKAVQVDLEGIGLESDAVSSDGIHIARVRGDSAIMLPDAQPYPLVGNNLTVYLGDDEYHRWALRGVSQAQIGEIRAWRKAAKHRGRSYEFSPDILVDHPITHFIRWALGQAEVELTAIFDAAEKMLRGELPLLDFVEVEAVV